MFCVQRFRPGAQVAELGLHGLDASLDGLDVGLHSCQSFVHNLQVSFNALQIVHRLPPIGSGQALLRPGIDVLPPCRQAKPPVGRVIPRTAAPVCAQGLPAFR